MTHGWSKPKKDEQSVTSTKKLSYSSLCSSATASMGPWSLLEDSCPVDATDQ